LKAFSLHFERVFADKSLLDQCDIISDSSGVGTSNSGGSGGGYDTGAGLLLAGVTAVCTENYSSNTPGHLCLTQGDIVEGDFFCYGLTPPALNYLHILEYGTQNIVKVN
jgi:hypothetical protein